MNLITLPFAAVCVAGLALAGGLEAQPAPGAIAFPALPAASPVGTLKQRVGLSDIEIVYGRPSMRRHLTFGGLVPYGLVWRTGDGASTKISFSTPVKLNGTPIPAGKYALYTIPDEKEWTVIIYKDIGLWGADNYDPMKDQARFNAAPVKLADTVETFTFDINDLHDDSATLNLSWGRVRVPVKIELEIVDDLMVRVGGSMASPAKKSPKTYLDAANFYFDHGQEKDLETALQWVNTGLLNQSGLAYQLLHLKAKILAKQGDRTGAIAAAQQSSELAIQAEGPGTPYVKMNQDVISIFR